MPSYADLTALCVVLSIAIFDILSAERIYSTSPSSIALNNQDNWPKLGQSPGNSRRDWVNPNVNVNNAQNQQNARNQQNAQNHQNAQNQQNVRNQQNAQNQQNHQNAQNQQNFQSQSGQNLPNLNPTGQTLPGQRQQSQNSGSGGRDWVNPAFGNSNNRQQTSTTPWPALGSRPRPGNYPGGNPGHNPPGNRGSGNNQPGNPGAGNNPPGNPGSGNNPPGNPGSGNNPGIGNNPWGNPNQNQNIGSTGSVSLADVLKYPSHVPGWNTNIGGTTVRNPSAGSNQPPVSGGSPIRSPSSSSPSTDSNDEDNELKEFSENVLKKDVNNAAKFVTVNYQGKTSSGSKDDKALKPLLEIKPEAYNLPTISKLTPLYNNYILRTTESEYSTPQEKQEENALLDAILSTSIMQLTKNFLIQKGKISRDPREFRDIMKQIWFNMYARGGGKISSSGFEHVFLAEIKNQDVSGLHNWVYFNEQESKNEANYLGYMKTLDLGNKGAIIKYHFTFSNLDKPVGSMFIGTSPELEMALYSTCFLLKPDRPCPMKLNGHDFIIRTYTYRYRGKNMIGSAFPEI